jgi:hypothetical protein
VLQSDTILKYARNVEREMKWNVCWKERPLPHICFFFSLKMASFWCPRYINPKSRHQNQSLIAQKIFWCGISWKSSKNCRHGAATFLQTTRFWIPNVQFLMKTFIVLVSNKWICICLNNILRPFYMKMEENQP